MVSRPLASVHYPRSMGEFTAWFSTDADCRDYLEWLRWPQGFVCPGCAHAGGWRLADGRLMCAACGARTSPTAGTIFDRTRTPLTVWFTACWLLATQKDGISALSLQRSLETERRDPVLLGGEEPAGGEPHRQRRARAVEDRPRGGRCARAAGSAHQPAIGQPPATGVSAARAHEPLWPPQPLQVVPAVSVGREPGRELAHRPRVVDAGQRARDHPIILLRLDG